MRGRRGARWVAVSDVGKFALLVSGVVWLLVRGGDRLGYNWQWYRLPRYFFASDGGAWTAGPLVVGLAVTLQVTAMAVIVATAAGGGAALLRLSHSRLGRVVGRVYVEFVRNTPLLIQLFVMYFVLGPVLGIERFASAVLALGLFEGAYVCEILRGGIQSIDRGQWEGAHALGLTRAQAYREVILPQALRRVLPPLVGQAVSLVKDSALVSTIAVYDLAMRAQVLVAETYLTFEIWFAVAGVYLLLTLGLSLLARLVEHRLAAPA